VRQARCTGGSRKAILVHREKKHRVGVGKGRDPGNGLDLPDLGEDCIPVPGHVEQERGQDDRDHLSVRPDPVGTLEERLSGPAADIQHHIALSDIAAVDRGQAGWRKLTVDRGMGHRPSQRMHLAGLRVGDGLTVRQDERGSAESAAIFVASVGPLRSSGRDP